MNWSGEDRKHLRVVLDRVLFRMVAAGLEFVDAKRRIVRALKNDGYTADVARREGRLVVDRMVGTLHQ